ncbi:receptor-like protein kinase, partial [Trifolium medium]|nr:receptor-like protein kinase [Trifolium medium]
MSSKDHRLVQCNKKDEETLLIFKKGINDSSNGMTSTWSTKKDCCAWEGVYCDNNTGRVTEIDLNNQYLKGEINFSILELEFLSYLDLSWNEFDVINIPATQHNITHASNLFYLDLSSLYYVSLHMDNLNWLSPLSSLKYLNLSYIDLQKETNWLHVMATLPSLLELQLSHCNLNNFMINPSIEYLNLSSLVTLDLSYNNFTSQLPNWFFNLTNDLTYLDLYKSNIHGSIPHSWKNFTELEYINLWGNRLS